MKLITELWVYRLHKLALEFETFVADCFESFDYDAVIERGHLDSFCFLSVVASR